MNMNRMRKLLLEASRVRHRRWTVSLERNDEPAGCGSTFRLYKIATLLPRRSGPDRSADAAAKILK
jgi:hypothetical protein